MCDIFTLSFTETIAIGMHIFYKIILKTGILLDKIKYYNFKISGHKAHYAFLQ
jgi:hypothetical protein